MKSVSVFEGKVVVEEIEMENKVAFVPVNNGEVDGYLEWDIERGYGGMDQIQVEGGILVAAEMAEPMAKHVAEFEAWWADFVG